MGWNLLTLKFSWDFEGFEAVQYAQPAKNVHLSFVFKMAKSVDQISLIRLDHLVRQFGFSNGNLSSQIIVTSHDLGPSNGGET